MIALRRVRAGVGAARAYCELDRWSFDPRYTEGRCPICGWQAVGAPPAPAWLRIARRVEWELLGLFLLLVVLVVLAVVVARAAGISLPGPSFHQGGPAAVPTTSPAAATPSSTPRGASPAPSPSAR